MSIPIGEFPLLLHDDNRYFQVGGANQCAYHSLGAHLCENTGELGVRFSVWAPNAARVAVVGDFNNWQDCDHEMTLHTGNGIWELFVPGPGQGALYKYHITGADGTILPLKADPYAFAMQRPPENASVVWPLQEYQWQDNKWMRSRGPVNARNAPISIYEVHLGSWKRHSGEKVSYLNYRELAAQLIPYVKDLGFTHLELLPITEHPFDGSWGYQPLGMFAPTSRLGTPDDFRFFVDCCHQAGLAVLLDWVPAHFPSDEHGLGRFDGTCLYEHEDKRKGFHPDWNTLIYDYGKPEVIAFLLGNALFWLEEYHIDGLRVDAVASMLFLDYSRKEGEWLPNVHGGNENLEAIEFLRLLNTEAYSRNPDITMIAEESTAWPGVSRPVHEGGLGFGFKWNMGWMHDTLQYNCRAAADRQHNHFDIVFGLSYAFNENFVLPLSHDEVVHGRGSLLGRMPGADDERFANLRAYLAFMWTHPGKKLLFMGGELAQQQEWDHDAQLHWELLKQTPHEGVQRLVRDLNALYRALAALYERDCEAEGFEWIGDQGHASSVFTYLRRSAADGPPVIVACNFSLDQFDSYRIGVPEPGLYTELLNTDSKVYGGSDRINSAGVLAEEIPAQGRPWSIDLALQPLTCLVLQQEI